MTTTEKDVADHYTTGALFDRVLQALSAMGVAPDKATVADLKLGDEFHTGGVLATDHLMDQLDVPEDGQVLDVGCGIGGVSRYVADRFGAATMGVDLTPEFIETAEKLSALVGLSDKTSFAVGSALQMPVPDAQFDLAVMMHVGMNIEDKAALMADVSRALKPGGRFALFDVMKGGNPDPLAFPVPWSTLAETSFLAAPEAYVAAGAAAGLTLAVEADRTAFAKDFFEKALSAPPSPMGIHLMMGDTAPEKFKNYVANLHSDRLRPIEMIFDKTG